MHHTIYACASVIFTFDLPLSFTPRPALFCFANHITGSQGSKHLTCAFLFENMCAMQKVQIPSRFWKVPLFCRLRTKHFSNSDNFFVISQQLYRHKKSSCVRIFVSKIIHFYILSISTPLKSNENYANFFLCFLSSPKIICYGNARRISTPSQLFNIRARLLSECRSEISQLPFPLKRLLFTLRFGGAIPCHSIFPTSIMERKPHAGVSPSNKCDAIIFPFLGLSEWVCVGIK